MEKTKRKCKYGSLKKPIKLPSGRYRKCKQRKCKYGSLKKPIKLPSGRYRKCKKKYVNDVTKKCKNTLSKNIAKNISEHNKNNKYANRKQAIAIAYSQTKKLYPQCIHIFTR